MRKLFLVCIFAIGLGVALAQKDSKDSMSQRNSMDDLIGKNKDSMHTIDVPKPGVKDEPDRLTRELQHRDCADVNAQLLEVIKDLTDAESINNEMKFEADNRLTADSVYARRMTIIKNLAHQLRSRAGSK